MPDFSVEVGGLDKLLAALKRAPDMVETNLQKGVVKAAGAVVEQATRGNLPWRTGTLVKTFGIPPEGLKIERLVARVGPTVKYAVYVHEGTKAHTIYPKEKKALYWEGAAHPVRSVEHPGTKANPFMPRILEKARPKISTIFKDAINASLRSLI